MNRIDMPLAGDAPAWKRRDWIIWITALFIGQLAMIGILSRPSAEAVPAQVQEAQIPNYRLLPASDIWLNLLWVEDPTVSLLANPHGFSGIAWRNRKPPELRVLEYQEPPAWLEWNMGDLGRFSRSTAGPREEGFLADKPNPQPGRSPIPVASPIQESGFEMVGPLTSLRLLTPAKLPGWEHTDVLTNSVVQVMVDGNGEVVSAALMKRSGLALADRAAVALVWTMRFGSGQTELRPSQLIDGQIIFRWHTLPVRATNAPAGPPR